jgi:predicted acetyltransferase
MRSTSEKSASGLQLEWVGESANDRVALTRMRCYAASSTKYPHYQAGIALDGRHKPGDFLLATRDGVDVGTTTALSLQLWLRGARLSCQGVAYVGTIKTHRRGGATSSPTAGPTASPTERGIASQLMASTIDKARERGQVVSALMPFRASFYEHFGYGNAEHRVEWTVPLSLMPRGDFDGYHFYEPADDAGILELRAREAALGQCDIETDAAALANWKREWETGIVFVDSATGRSTGTSTGGATNGLVRIIEDRGPQYATAIVEDWSAATPEALRRILYFLGSLKDQYSFARITLPRDVPLNRLLRESQVPHRQVDHPVATARPYTRMQIRVLDHKRLLEAVQLPPSTQGKFTLAIKETEGNVSRLAIDINAGRCSVREGPADCPVELTDVVWASIVSGDLTATQAHTLGLMRSSSTDATTLLDAFSVGPAPFCQEYF